MRYRKTQVFLYIVLPFYSYTKIKTRKIQHIILNTFTKKTCYKIQQNFNGGLLELEILEIFTIGLLLKA